MANDPHATSSFPPANASHNFDPVLEAGLAVAFGPEMTAGGWTQPPLLRDDPSGDNGENPIVQPTSNEMPRGSSDRYQLLGEIARGGMGVILKGRDPDLGRDLAFKVLKGELSRKPEAVQRFVEEAQVAGQLQHPGVVPVYDLGRFGDGRPYFAMKLVKGRTLADLLAERTDPAQNRGRYLQNFLQVCHTIAYAHAKGVIHRDLKPSNVMVGNFNEVLVMDWGLAKVLPRGGVADERKATEVARGAERPPEEFTVIRTARHGSGSETEEGSMLGTPAFMPPEQAGGEIDKLDERADVFGLGAILSVILTGDPPYRADSGEAVRLMAIRGHLADAYKRLDGCGADAALVELCKQCLAIDPAERPRDASRVADAVIAYQSSVAERLHRAEVEQAEQRVRLKEAHRRRRMQAALGMTFTVLVVLGGAFAWWTQDLRRAKSARIDLTLNGAEVLKEQAAGDTNNPVNRWQDAEAAVGKAESVLGDDASPAAKARLESLRAAIAAGLKQAQGNQTLLEQIDLIRNEKEGKEADEAFAAAFRAAGLDVDALTAAEFAKRLAAKPAAVCAVAAPTLDVWAMFRRGQMFNGDTRIEKGVKHLFDLAREVDPDSWRNKLRSALQERNLIALHELAEKTEEKEKQGPTHLWLLGLGHALCGDNKGAADVLRPAVQKYPGDYALTLELAFAIEEANRTGTNSAYAVVHSTNATLYQQAEPFVRASVALRPASPRPRQVLAISLRQQDRLPEAEQEFQAAVRLAPNDSFPRCSYAWFFRSTGREKESLELYRKALAINPAENRALRLVEDAILKEGGSVDEVIEMYRKAAAHQPHGGTGALAKALERHGRKDEAVDVLKKAIAAEPTWRRYRFTLGQMFQRMNKPEEIVALFQAAIDAEPSDALYRQWLGFALESKKDLHGAIAAYEDTIRLDPAHYYPYSALGRIYIGQNDPEKAVPLLRKAIALRPRYIYAHTELLNALASLNKLDSAVEDYKKMIAHDPKDPFWHYRLGIALEKMKENKAAAEAYRDAIKLFPKYHEARTALGVLLRNSKQYEQVVELCREGIAVDPKYDFYNTYLVFALSEMGKTDEAIAACRAALAADPKSYSARFRLMSALRIAGRFDDAVYELELLIEAEPKTAGLHYQLGRLREHQGRLNDAIAAYRRAKELYPNTNFYDHTLALALAKTGEIGEASKLLTEEALRDPTSEGSLSGGITCRAIKDGPGYEKIRKELLDRYGKGSDFTTIDHTVKVWLLDPNLTDKLPVITALAERAVTEGKFSPYYRKFRGYVEMTRGLAALRNGEWSKAIEWCDAAPGHTTEGRLRTECEAGCRAIKAMALFQQGGEERQTAARKELAAAVKILTEGENDLVVPKSINHLFARVLADEAAALISGMKHGPRPQEEKK